MAARKDAELVPLWVGKYDPALLALARVGVSSTQVEQATDLFVLVPVGRVDVEVEPVLDRLAFRDHRRADGDSSGVFGLHLVVKDRAPELGETAGIGTVDRKLGELTGHTSAFGSGSGSPRATR